MSCTPDSPQTDAFTVPIPIPEGRCNCASKWISSACASHIARAPSWQWLPEQFDASILSDEATAPGAPNFTGAFVGVACQDMSGTAQTADFDFFEYREREYRRAVC